MKLDLREITGNCNKKSRIFVNTLHCQTNSWKRRNRRNYKIMKPGSLWNSSNNIRGRGRERERNIPKREFVLLALWTPFSIAVARKRAYIFWSKCPFWSHVSVLSCSWFFVKTDGANRLNEQRTIKKTTVQHRPVRIVFKLFDLIKK